MNILQYFKSEYYILHFRMVLTCKKKYIYGLGPNGSTAHQIVMISPLKFQVKT